ncbi:hypothetical protein Tco_0223955 [Tanacetum coccineum]
MLYEALEKSMAYDHTDQLLTDLAKGRRKKKKRRDSPKIFKSLSFSLDRLCHLTILCLGQHAHTLHLIESLLIISPEANRIHMNFHDMVSQLYWPFSLPEHLKADNTVKVNQIVTIFLIKPSIDFTGTSLIHIELHHRFFQLTQV